ncbi:hypothetical protein ACFWN2_22700 [Lentzea sp. NPDC058436]|uniref:hypothetical protein n=1 Tax=Lentzea sp. NPDC058436 TaxID=3346499 RepID=UPI00365A9065
MTSMAWALRPQLRYVVRQSVRQSFAAAAPLVPRGPAWVHWAQHARWADFLTRAVVTRLLVELTKPTWLPLWLPRSSQTGGGAPAGAPPGGANKPAADRSRQLSVADLLRMMINEPGQYLVHRTFNQAVGELWEGTVIDARYPAGTRDLNAPAGIYAVPGLVGVPYGDWCVIFKKNGTGHHFGSVAATANAPNANKEEMVCLQSIPVSAAFGWSTSADAEEAKRRYDEHKKTAGTSK